MEVDVSADGSARVELRLKGKTRLSGSVATPEGLGIAAVEVFAYGSNQVFVRSVFTDARGHFETDLSPDAADVVFQVGSPGWALKVGRTELPTDGRPLTFRLDHTSGRLVVEAAKDPRNLYLVHQGATVSLALLSRWAAQNGGGLEDERFVLPALEPGEYSLCWGDRPPAAGDNTRCRSQTIAPSSDAVVRAGGPATTTARD